MDKIEEKTPLISVIVPVYKVEPFLRRCLDSIVSQTYQNLEIILVDDGSPDRCGAICDEYAAGDQRIIVIHQENKGLAQARNAGLDIATGDFIQFVDSDDWLEDAACESALKDALGQNADMVCFGFYQVAPSGKSCPNAATSSGIQEKGSVMGQLIRQRWIGADCVWNKLYSKTLFDGIRFPEGRVHEDLGALYRLIHRSRVVYVSSSVLYNYFQRPGSIMTERHRYSAHSDRMYQYAERLSLLEREYPELADLQLALMLREILVFRHELGKGPHAEDMDRELQDFVDRYGDRIKALTKYSRIVWCYHHCRPLLPLAIRWRRWY